MKKTKTFEEVMEEMITCEAECVLERELTQDEYEDVYERVFGDLCELIQEKLYEVGEESQLLERNEGSEKRKLYYRVMFKNPNAYVNEFKDIFSAKTLEDARTYIKQVSSLAGDDEFKVVRVENGVDKEEMSYHKF